MAIIEFVGCTLVAFGPPLVIFMLTIVRNPLKIIVMTASAFFWLIALLLSAIVWYAVVPLRNTLAFGLFVSVFFQELLRFLFYKIMKKADDGLLKMALGRNSQLNGSPRQVILHPHIISYVHGIGFGLMSGAFSQVNLLADMVGPATVGLEDDAQEFFLISAFLTLAFILLHIFWGVIFFASINTKCYWKAAVIVGLHFLCSGLTMINNSNTKLHYLGTVLPAYIILFICMIWAFFEAGGNKQALLQSFCFFCSQQLTRQDNRNTVNNEQCVQVQ